MDSFSLEACRRAPLADAALRVFDYLLEPTALADVFTRHRGKSVERKIAFPDFVRLLADGLLGHRADSAHQTFRLAIRDNTLDATVQAAYGKLARTPRTLRLGLFDHAAARLHDLAPVGRPPSADAAGPASPAGFRLLAFDGKKLKCVAHKRKALRGLHGNVYGGKLLVVQDMRTKTAVAVEAVADGEAGDALLVPGVVARVRASTADPTPRLWIADRGFCDSRTLRLLGEGQDRYVMRYISSHEFHRDSTTPTRAGRDRQGRAYVEEWGHPGSGERTVVVRKVTVTRPGLQPFAVVTNLSDADEYPADDPLELYRRRWGIETMFRQVVRTFDPRHRIGSTPQATVFQAVLCLLLYDVTLVVADVVAETADRDRETVSLRLLFDSLRREVTGCFRWWDRTRW